MSRKQAIALGYGLAAVIIVVDQITKAIVVATLGQDNPPVLVLIPGVLELVFRLNTGMAFSLLVNFPQLLTIVAAVASIVLTVVNARMRASDLLSRLAIGLLLGGAVGNLIDRLRVGAVIDFVYVSLINFPAFNVADSSLTIGVLLAAWVLSRAPENDEGREVQGQGSEVRE
jgi:signal peptidase II